MFLILKSIKVSEWLLVSCCFQQCLNFITLCQLDVEGKPEVMHNHGELSALRRRLDSGTPKGRSANSEPWTTGSPGIKTIVICKA